MKIPLLLTLALLAIGRLYSQEDKTSVPTALPEKPALVFRVLSESVVRQKDGGSVTFRRVEAPLLPPEPVVVEQPVPTLSEVEMARMKRLERKPNLMLGISASVHEGGITVLRWTCGASQRLQAVSNVDFRFLTGMGSLETNKASYFIFMSAGPDAQPLSAEEAMAVKSLTANGRPSFVLLGGSAAAGKEDERALEAMEALLDHYDAHRDELMKQYAQREAERAARALAERHAPPPPPRQAVIHFWPLQPAQREAINAQVQREAATKAALQQDALRVKGGKQ